VSWRRIMVIVLSALVAAAEATQMTLAEAGDDVTPHKLLGAAAGGLMLWAAPWFGDTKR